MKQKTHKATAKRFKITVNKKVLERRCNQDHFNARDTGEKTRAKRRDMLTNKAMKKHVKRLLPHNLNI